ncbi:UNVERIFIED_CONTAM: hypothetical protein FKN15_042156 [Acipenser sinensis]
MLTGGLVIVIFVCYSTEQAHPLKPDVLLQAQKWRSLEQYLKNTKLNEPVIGLQYVAEFRSPNDELPPHYLCKLCKVKAKQLGFVTHITGWKHRYNYMVVIEDLKEDPALKRPKTEPDARKTATKIPRVDMPRAQLKGGRFPNAGPPGRHQDDFRRGLHPGDFPGRLHPDHFPRQMHPRDFPSDFHTRMPSDDFPVGMAREDIPAKMHDEAFPSMGYLDDPGRRYPDEFPSGRYPEGGPLRAERMRLEMSNFENRCSDMRSEFEMHLTRRQGMDRMAPMEDEGVYTRGCESGLASSAVFECLENFHIETEGDAQMVLKITHKLTDILMEYRLRNVAAENFHIETEGDAQMVLKITQKLTDILMEYRLRNVAAKGHHGMLCSLGGGHLHGRNPESYCLYSTGLPSLAGQAVFRRLL